MLTIKRTSSANVDRYIKLLACGEPGTGKTLLGSTWPNPLYLTTEGLMMSVADRDVPYHHLKSLDELLIAVKMLQQPKEVREKQFGVPVETIVIDTIDDVSMMLLKERVRTEGHALPQLQDYGWLKDQMTEIVAALRNLDMNVILACHLKQREVGGMSTLIPAIEGGFADKIAGYVDIAVVLQTRLTTKVVGNDSVRVVEHFIQTIQDPQHRFIKDHSGKLPAEFELNFVDDYERLATIIYGEAHANREQEPEVIVQVAKPAEPEPAPLEAPLEGTLEAAAAAETTTYSCSSCSDTFTDEDQFIRCQIKGWPTLCDPCSKARLLQQN